MEIAREIDKIDVVRYQTNEIFMFTLMFVITVLTKTTILTVNLDILYPHHNKPDHTEDF